MKPKIDSLCTDPSSPPIFIEGRGSVHRLKIDMSISEKFHKSFPRILREINVKYPLRDNSCEILAKDCVKFRRCKFCFFRVIFDGFVFILFLEFKWYFRPVFVLFLCSFDRFLYCLQTTLRLFSYNFILFLHFCILFFMYFHNICVLLLFLFCGILILFSKCFYFICSSILLNFETY